MSPLPLLKAFPSSGYVKIQSQDTVMAEVGAFPRSIQGFSRRQVGWESRRIVPVCNSCSPDFVVARVFAAGTATVPEWQPHCWGTQLTKRLEKQHQLNSTPVSTPPKPFELA